MNVTILTCVAVAGDRILRESRPDWSELRSQERGEARPMYEEYLDLDDEPYPDDGLEERFPPEQPDNWQYSSTLLVRHFSQSVGFAKCCYH